MSDKRQHRSFGSLADLSVKEVELQEKGYTRTTDRRAGGQREYCLAKDERETGEGQYMLAWKGD